MEDGEYDEQNFNLYVGNYPCLECPRGPLSDGKSADRMCECSISKKIIIKRDKTNGHYKRTIRKN